MTYPERVQIETGQAAQRVRNMRAAALSASAISGTADRWTRALRSLEASAARMAETCASQALGPLRCSTVIARSTKVKKAVSSSAAACRFDGSVKAGSPGTAIERTDSDRIGRSAVNLWRDVGDGLLESWALRNGTTVDDTGAAYLPAANIADRSNANAIATPWGAIGDAGLYRRQPALRPKRSWRACSAAMATAWRRGSASAGSTGLALASLAARSRQLAKTSVGQPIRSKNSTSAVWRMPSRKNTASGSRAGGEVMPSTYNNWRAPCHAAKVAAKRGGDHRVQSVPVLVSQAVHAAKVRRCAAPVSRNRQASIPEAAA